MEKIVALKVDVNSYVGTRDGVPRLLDGMADIGAKATFYFSMGPDNSGKIMRRIFTRRGFLKHFMRSKIPMSCDIKTLLYGTLLPAPMIGESFPDLLKSVELAGHQVGIHSWDHVKWEDYLPWFPKHLTAMELGRAAAMFEDIFGYRAVTTAAPGGMVTEDSLEVQDAMGLDYSSDCRGTHPFYPVVNGRRFRTLQIPVTLPHVDEIMGSNGINPDNLHEHYFSILQQGVNVLAISAEKEGKTLYDSFIRLLKKLKDENIRCISLGQVAQEITSASACELYMGEIPGLVGKVAIQGSKIK